MLSRVASLDPLVTVVIAARNEGRYVDQCLESLLRQDLPGVEIILVDDGSTDGTGEAASRHEGVRVIRGEGRGPGRARNLGLESANGRFVAFTDADCVVEPDWLSRLVEALESAPEEVWGVGGAQEAPPDDPPFARLVQRFLSSIGFVSEYVRTDPRTCPTLHNPTCNSMLRSAVLEELGGFAEGLWPCEDLELDRRIELAGGKLLYVPGARVLHHRPENARGFLKMMRGYGLGHAALVRIHGPFRMIHLLPAVSVAGVAFLGGTLVVSRAAFGALVGGGLLAVWGALAWRSRSLPEGLAHALMLAGAVAAWNVGFAEGMATGRRLAPSK